MVMEPILWLQSYLEVRCKEHNLVGGWRHEENAHLPEPSPPVPQENKRHTRSRRSRRVPEVPFDPGDAQVVIDFFRCWQGQDRSYRSRR
jgi:hypothetical protein